MPTIILETERTYLRHFELNDADWLIAMDTDPKVMKHLGGVISEEQVRAYIPRVIENYKKYPGMGAFATVLKTTEETIGWSSIKPLPRTEYIEIGWRYLPNYWGKGYATETAKAMLDYGFENFDMDVIISVADDDNYGSTGAMKKAGLTYWKTEPYNGWDKVAWYRIFRKEWEETNKKF